ncbi:MAG: hypothetical protein Kow00109_11800 [Acidobacteriota bacterium]
MSEPTILVVDDSPVMRASMTRALRPVTSKVLQAENGSRGLEIARRQRVDLIVSDVDMPELNGIEFCRRLRQNPETLGTPVILVSSFDTDADIERGFSAGATAYLSKTDGAARVIEVVEEILQRRRHQRNQTILVVEDSPSIRSLLSRNLREAGFRVLEAGGHREAIQLLAREIPDLVLGEADLEPQGGRSLVRLVKDHTGNREVPVIVMTAMGERGHVRRILQEGAAAFIAKPFNIDELVVLVERILADRLRLLLQEREHLDRERQLILESISSLVSALEARDPYTRGHSEAVAELVAAMVEVTGAPETQVERARLGGRLHDIGKIGVPDRILLKEGPLTDEEFALVRRHPLIGARILENIASLRDVCEIVRHHHERYDGKGYPDGLAGEEIPLLARFTAVADTFHALTSERPYRPAQTPLQALEIIKDAQGTQLCPQAVEVFFELVRLRPALVFGESVDVPPDMLLEPAERGRPAADQAPRRLDLPPPPESARPSSR